MQEPLGVTRRGFLSAGTIAAGAMAMSARSHARTIGANDRLGAAIVGCGGMGGSHLDTLIAIAAEDNIDVRMTCDVNPERANAFRDRVNDSGGKAVAVTDYDNVLGSPDIDYILVAVPEHGHHYLTMEALGAGKHVYCEKPMCYDVREAKEVVERAAQTGLKLQVGVQGMADDSYSSALDAIRAGKIGKVVAAEIEYVRNHPAGSGPWRRTSVSDATAMPEGLDWARWLYPREPRPWDPHHYFEWRCYRAYSGGIATDLFVHRITRIIRACGLTFPARVAGLGGIYTWNDGRDLPDSMEMLLEYPAVEGVTDGMTVRLLGTMANKRPSPHCIRGKSGTLVFTSTGWDIISEDDGKTSESHVKTGGEDLRPHHMNHHAAIRTGEALFCPPELGLYGVVAARMGNLSWFQQKMVAWDADNEYVVAL